MQSLRPVLQFAGRVAPAPTGLLRTTEAKKLMRGIARRCLDDNAGRGEKLGPKALLYGHWEFRDRRAGFRLLGE